MFSDAPQQAIDSIIGRACQIHGNVVFRGGLRLDGQILGNLQAAAESAGYLMLAPGSRVEGEVRAGVIIVAGTVAGNLFAADKLILHMQARIVGDLHYRMLSMQPGAIVSGRLCHLPAEALQAGPAAVAKTMPAQALRLKLA